MWKLTTSKTAILFPLYYDGNNPNQMNAENEDDFLHRLATKVKKTNLTKRHTAVTFESVHVKSLQINQFFMVTVIPYNATPCSKSQNDFFSVFNVSFGF